MYHTKIKKDTFEKKKKGLKGPEGSPVKTSAVLKMYIYMHEKQWMVTN